MTPCLLVPKVEFADALRTLQRTGSPKTRVQAILSMAGDDLLLECGGGAVRITATGRWSGTIRVDGNTLLRLDGHLPQEDTIELALEDTHLRIGSLRLPCVWDGEAAPDIRLPVNPTLRHIVTLGMRHSAEELERAGLLLTVRAGEARANALIERGARTLAPLGITEEVIRSWIEG
jgi:hypothetical protein